MNTAITAQTVYESTVMALSKSERLKLAALILDELSESAGSALDFSDSWTEEDLRDLRASLLDLQPPGVP